MDPEWFSLGNHLAVAVCPLTDQPNLDAGFQVVLHQEACQEQAVAT